MPAITDVLTGQIILACWAIFLVFWGITSFFTKKTVERRGGMGTQIAIRLAVMIVVILVLQRFIPGFGRLALWPYSTTSGVIADILAVCGLVIMLWARVTLGGNWSATVVLKEDHEIIQRGPYAVVRHPIYSGLLLLFLGEAVWYGSVAWFLIFAGVALGFWLKAKSEEALLMEHFPDVYASYRKRTKMLIPFLF